MRIKQIKLLFLVTSAASFLSPLACFAVKGELSNLDLVKANGPKNSNISYNLNFSTKAAGFSEGEDSASLVLFGISPSIKFKYGNEFYINADATLNLSSSRTQSRYTSYSDNNFVLNDLSLNYGPANFATLSLGSLSQSHLESPFLVSSLSFPGAALKLERTGELLSVGLKAQTLIPTSNSLDSDRTEKEALPNLQTVGLYSHLRLTPFLAFGGQVNRYQFSNLPAVVAYESKRLGNTVTGIEVGDSRFATEFLGIAQSYYSSINYTNYLNQKISISIVENEKINKGSNRAQMIETSISYTLSSAVDLIPGVGFFYAESDVAPAYYNSSSLGHNNRQGQKYSFKAVFKKMNLSTQVSFVEARVINSSVYQNDLSSVELLMEMLNVRF